MSKHAPAPSIDLEGGESVRINRRPSVLSIRTDQLPRHAYPSPSTPSSAHSPTLSPTPWSASPHASPDLARPPSPNVNYFSTLPPSPPRSTPPSPPPHFTAQHQLPPPPVAANSSYPVTPPDSARPNKKAFSMFPESALHPATTGLNGAAVKRANSEGDRLSPAIDLLSVPSDGEQEETDGGSFGKPPKRRPSLILTEATDNGAMPQYGLALGMDASAPLSPRLGKRQYPTEHSSTTPTTEHFSTTPISSPTIPSFPAFLSPTLGSSPTLPSHVSPSAPPSPKLSAEPPSPRLSAFADPLARLVRRASSSALNSSSNTDLPTSISRSPSPARSASACSSPSLSVGTASPVLGARRRSFAAEARDKEEEKKREIEEREEKEKEKKVKMHMRMFSWAERPEDRKAKAKSKSKGKPSSWTAVPGGFKLKVVLAIVTACVVWWTFWGSSRTTTRPVRREPPLREGANRILRDHSRLRRHPEAGHSFIHPEVINRPKPPSMLSGSLKWLRNFFVIDGRPLPDRYDPGTVTRPKRRDDSPVREDAFPTQPKTRNIFVPAKKTAWEDHTPLPPPPVHNDAPERDTLVLYRILGNDLPPRHSPGQTLRNLRFLLQHESDFSALPHVGPHLTHHAHAYGSGSKKRGDHSEQGGLRVDKYFVLNRIAEPEIVSAIIGLLHTYSVPNSRILVIPFEYEEYAKRSFKWDGGVESLLGWGIGPQDAHPLLASQVISATPTGTAPPRVSNIDEVFGGNHPDRDELKIAETAPEGDEMTRAGKMKKRQDMLARLRAMDYTYHEKNLYAMNNNGGRNFALRHGRSLPNARWILPLDGNSFLTPAAMFSIVKTLSIAGEGPSASRYLIMPMARLLDNFDVLRNNSIAQVPLHVQQSDMPSLSASHEAEHHHRPPGAPETPEEPQVGFRYDSTEDYQEAMRYGRRSKLELLWRLGAIPYSRGLDSRTLPWETSDRLHVTKSTWGSIPGVLGTNASSQVHQPHGDFKPWVAPNPERGPLAYAKAGWVYRLFSGDRSQEEPSQEATQRRSINRIKGIVAFLEHLDEDVARGHAGCGADYVGRCGFHLQRLWNFEMEDVERLRQKYKGKRRDAIEKVEAFEEHVYKVHKSVSSLFSLPEKLFTVDAETAAKNATVLAMAAYLTHNSTYSQLASDFIAARFVKKVSIFHRQNEHRAKMNQYKKLDPAVENKIRDAEDDFGYAFPPPPKGAAVWSNDLGENVASDSAGLFPFDPLAFDPSYLLDAVRLLQHANAPRSSIDSSDKALDQMVTALLTHLLFSPEAIALCRNPATRSEGSAFDAKVASLAAYMDDVRLLGRVANRARLRLPPHLRHEGMMQNSLEVRHLHRRLLDGLSNLHLVPYSLVERPQIADLRGQVKHEGKMLLFALLGL